MEPDTLILVGAVIGSSAFTTLLWFALGDRRRKGQPEGLAFAQRENAVTDRIPAPPAPSVSDEKIEKALNQMFYSGVTFAHQLNQQRREVRRDKQYVVRAAGQRCEQVRTKVRREIGI